MHYYNDLSSFFLLIKEVLWRVQSEERLQYRIKQTELCRLRPNNIHFSLLVFLASHVVSFSFFNLQPRSAGCSDVR